MVINTQGFGSDVTNIELPHAEALEQFRHQFAAKHYEIRIKEPRKKPEPILVGEEW